MAKSYRNLPDCTKDFRNLNSMVTWCINWRRLLALIIFQRSSLKWFPIIKRLAIKINVLQQTACLVVNPIMVGKVSKGAKIRNRYNQVPHLNQDTKGKVTNLQQDTTNENQEVSPFPAGEHKAHINGRSQRHSKHTTEKTKILHKKCRLGMVSKIFYWRA